MKSVTTRRFRECFATLPEKVREQARRAYVLFRENPAHPGLNFKKIDEEYNLYSVRIGLAYRALGQLEGETVLWFWIGSHADYDKLI